MENIKSSPLVDLLNERNCITSEERDHMNNQPDNYARNDALLGWLRTITFTGKKGQKVLECFNDAGQNLVADLLGKGGGGNHNLSDLKPSIICISRIVTVA